MSELMWYLATLVLFIIMMIVIEYQSRLIRRYMKIAKESIEQTEKSLAHQHVLEGKLKTARDTILFIHKRGVYNAQTQCYTISEVALKKAALSLD
jgi:hypothetical protein